MIDDFIKQLEQELKLSGVFSSEVPGVYAFSLDEEIPITVTDTAPGFHLTATLGTVPKGKVEDFFGKMLLGNLFGRATRNAVLGLDEKEENCIVQLIYSKSASYKEFVAELEDFINTADFWKQELKAHSEAKSEDSTPIL